MLKMQNPDVVGHYSYVVRCAIRHRMRNAELYPPAIKSDELLSRAISLDLESPF